MAQKIVDRVDAVRQDELMEGMYMSTELFEMELQEKGREEGLKEGMEKGIRAMVSALQKITLAPAVIAQTLVEQFGLSQDAAEQKVRQYWS